MIRFWVIILLAMAFGVGARISSISFQLVLPSLETAGAPKDGLGLLIGALLFFIGALLIERLGGKGLSVLLARQRRTIVLVSCWEPS